MRKAIEQCPESDFQEMNEYQQPNQAHEPYSRHPVHQRDIVLWPYPSQGPGKSGDMRPCGDRDEEDRDDRFY